MSAAHFYYFATGVSSRVLPSLYVQPTVGGVCLSKGANLVCRGDSVTVQWVIS